MVASDELLSTLDIGDIATEALLFQTGYLTMLHREDRGGYPFYRLGYPSREVRQSLNLSLLRHSVKDRSRHTANSIRLYDLLEAADFEGPSHCRFPEVFHDGLNCSFAEPKELPNRRARTLIVASVRGFECLPNPTYWPLDCRVRRIIKHLSNDCSANPGVRAPLDFDQGRDRVLIHKQEVHRPAVAALVAGHAHLTIDEKPSSRIDTIDLFAGQQLRMICQQRLQEIL